MLAEALLGLVLLMNQPAAQEPPTLELILHEGGYDFAVRRDDKVAIEAPPPVSIVDVEQLQFEMGDEGKPIILADLLVLNQDNLRTYCLGEEAKWSRADNASLRERVTRGDEEAEDVLECRIFNLQLSIVEELKLLNLSRGVRPAPDEEQEPTLKESPEKILKPDPKLEIASLR